MPVRFVDISMPVFAVRRLARQTDARTAGDVGYVIKTGLAEAFGHGTVRPWRLVSSDSTYRIVGVVEDAAGVKANVNSRNLGIVTEILDFEFVRGATLKLDVQALPIKHVPVKIGQGTVRHTYPSVAVERIETDLGFDFVEPRDRAVRERAYAPWLVSKLTEDGGGFDVIDFPDIKSTSPVNVTHKLHGVVKRILMPCVKAEVPVRVVDVEAANRFVRQGLKKRKDLGMGAMIPREVLEAVQ